jgi:hypothetical protein
VNRGRNAYMIRALLVAVAARARLVAYDRAVRPEPVAPGNVHSTATAPVHTGSGPHRPR